MFGGVWRRFQIIFFCPLRHLRFASAIKSSCELEQLVFKKLHPAETSSAAYPNVSKLALPLSVFFVYVRTLFSGKEYQNVIN
jgi:hypothetical protein